MRNRNWLFLLVASLMLGVATLMVSSHVVRADDDDDPQAAAKAAAAKAYDAFKARKPTEVVHKPPLDVDKANPIGTMKNPYTDQADKIEEGQKLYFSSSCNGC
ncbi:MAG: hypothetical protein ABWX70_07380, partial [Hyphomicrobium sp.]